MERGLCSLGLLELARVLSLDSAHTERERDRERDRERERERERVGLGLVPTLA